MRLMTILVLLLTACAVSLSTTQTPDAHDELQMLQGEWRVIAMEDDGVRAPFTDIKGMRWEFQGTSLLAADPNEELRPWSSVRLDSTKNPKQIDLVLSTGPDKGKSVPGIFRVEHDRLFVCSGEEPNDERPTEFTSLPESSRCLIVLERAGK